MKSNEQTRKIPVIIVTSSKEDTDITTACNLGVNSYIVKPVNFDKFVKTMNPIRYILVNGQRNIKIAAV